MEGTKKKLSIDERKWWVFRKEKFIGEISGLLEKGQVEIVETVLGEGSYFFQFPLQRDKKVTIKFEDEDITQYFKDLVGGGKIGEYGEWIMTNDKQLRKKLRVALEMVPLRGKARKDFMYLRAVWIAEDKEDARRYERRWGPELDLTWDWTPIPYEIEDEGDLKETWLKRYKKGLSINYDRIGGLLTGKIVEINFKPIERIITIKGEQEVLVGEVGLGLGGKKQKNGEYIINDKINLREVIRILEDRLKGDVKRRFTAFKKEEIKNILEEDKNGALKLK